LSTSNGALQDILDSVKAKAKEFAESKEADECEIKLDLSELSEANDTPFTSIVSKIRDGFGSEELKIKASLSNSTLKIMLIKRW